MMSTFQPMSMALARRLTLVLLVIVTTSHASGEAQALTIEPGQLAQAILEQPSLQAEASLALRVNDSRFEPVPAPVTVLTSEGATQRKARMQERLTSAGANFSFFDGIDGSKKIPKVEKTAEQTAREEIMWGLNIDALKHFEVKPTKLCENTTFQHFACTISHMLLVYKAYMANESMLLVLEDDMEILRWPTTGLLDSAPADWEVLMLYSLGGQANDLYRSENASLWHAWTFEDKLFNTGAYLINRKGMKQMIDTYLPGAISKGSVSTIDFTPVKHSDGCHADLVIYLPVKTYFCTDLYFVEEGRDSILATNANYLSFHQATRDIVRHLVKHRGFRHHYHRRALDERPSHHA